MSTHPERLGKYRITGVLGEGAMGVVYRGFDPDIRRLVALKTIRRQAPGDGGTSVAESAARFRNEAQAAGRYKDAADHLLIFLSAKLGWEDGKAKTKLLQVFEAAGATDPVTIEGRRRLASLMFA